VETRRLPLVLALTLGLASSGCASETRRELSASPAPSASSADAGFRERSRRLEAQLLAARRRIAELEAESPAAAQAPPEDPYRAVRVRFGRFTGGLDTDREPGPERLKVVIEPIDAEGDVVKRAGALELELYDDGADEPRLLKRWEFSRSELAKTWLSGFGIYAYVLKLDWPGGSPPESDKLLLRARFTTLRGKELEAEKRLAPKSRD
jgi:hypothetical protein